VPVYRCSEHCFPERLGTARGALGVRHTVRVSAQPLRLETNGAASPEEAAAVVAALERFMRATAPTSAEPQQHSDPWQRAAILEGVERESQDDASDPWINT
jgi:hypothetical protein